jgi:hypothetical protein
MTFAKAGSLLEALNVKSQIDLPNKNASGRIVSAGKIAVLGGENSFLRL